MNVPCCHNSLQNKVMFYRLYSRWRLCLSYIYGIHSFRPLLHVSVILVTPLCPNLAQLEFSCCCIRLVKWKFGSVLLALFVFVSYFFLFLPDIYAVLLGLRYFLTFMCEVTHCLYCRSMHTDHAYCPAKSPPQRPIQIQENP